MFIEEVEKRLCAKEVTFEAFVKRVLEDVHQFSHMLYVEKMEAEGVVVSRRVQLSATEAKPQGDVSAHLGADKLRQAAQTGHGMSGGKSVTQVLAKVGLDWRKILDFPFLHQDPQHCVVKIEIAHHLTTCDHLGQGAVSHSDVRIVRAQRNGTQQFSASVRVLLEFVRIPDSSEVGNAGFEFGLEVGVVEDAKGTGIDVIDNRLFQAQKEGLAFIDEYLRHIFIHNDGALHQIFGELVKFHVLVQLSLLCASCSRHLVGPNLIQRVSSAQVAAKCDQSSDFLVEITDGLIGEVVVGHFGSDVEGSCSVLTPESAPDGHAHWLLLSLGFGVFLQKTGFHVDELVLHFRIGVSTHVLGNDQLLDLLEVGLEILDADLGKLLKDLEVLLSVLHHCSQRIITTFAENSALSVTGEGTSDRKVGLSPPADGVADGFADVEAFAVGLFQDLITLFHIMPHDLSIGDEDDVRVFLGHHLLGNLPGIIATTALLSGNELPEFLLAGRSSVVVPEVVVADRGGVFCDDICNDSPVVGETTH